MHYYKRNLGDYAKKAGRLSMLQHGAYTLLLDACYDRERFPTEEEAIEWTWASTPEEEQAVRFVLSRFFELQDDKTYVQPRVYEELQIYKISEIQNRLIALSREAKKQKRNAFAVACDQLRAEIKHEPLKNTHAAWSGVVDALIKEHEAPPNHKPLTTNHKPIVNTKNTMSETAGVTDRFEVFWSFARDEYKKLGDPVGTKSEALAAFQKLKPDDALCKSMCETLRLQVQAKLVRRSYGRDSPQLKHVCRWISKACYNDEPDPTPLGEPPHGHRDNQPRPDNSLAGRVRQGCDERLRELQAGEDPGGAAVATHD